MTEEELLSDKKLINCARVVVLLYALFFVLYLSFCLLVSPFCSLRFPCCLFLIVFPPFPLLVGLPLSSISSHCFSHFSDSFLCSIPHRLSSPSFYFSLLINFASHHFSLPSFGFSLLASRFFHTSSCFSVLICFFVICRFGVLASLSLFSELVSLLAALLSSTSYLLPPFCAVLSCVSDSAFCLLPPSIPFLLFCLLFVCLLVYSAFSSVKSQHAPQICSCNIFSLSVSATVFLLSPFPPPCFTYAILFALDLSKVRLRHCI